MPAYDESAFPKAAAPALAVASLASFRWRATPEATGRMGLEGPIHTFSGRYAIALALAHAGLQPGDRVLLPAYHCLAMVEPVRAVGLMPLYYPVGADLSVSAETIARLAQSGAKALIVVHYFGFVRDLAALRAVADRCGLVLIEDCAHALLGGPAGLPVGRTGDYAIGSTQKFYPIPHGGILTSGRRDLSGLRLAAPPLRAELGAIAQTLGRAMQYRRLGRLGRVLGGLARLAARLRRGLAGQPRTRAQAQAVRGAPPEYAMDRRWLAWGATRTSRFLLARARTADLIRLRRAYYASYLQAVAGRTDCRPLFADLPEGVVPQVFPLYVNAGLEVFVTLKRQGVPIIRFGEFLDPAVTPELCPVGIDYSQHVLQFPCHQELSEPEAQWIRDRLVAALERARRGADADGSAAAAPGAR